MTSSRGFVLVNALIIVAALSAVAVWLLTRAETGRVQVAAAQEAVQLELNLDSYEHLAITVLDRDMQAVDHLNEDWSHSDPVLDLERGRVSGRIEDLQGRFNVNWLANSDDERIRDAFLVLATRLGVRQQTSRTIIAMVSGQGEPFGQGRPVRAEIPPRGPVFVLDQLPVPLTELLLLRPYVTALPTDSRLNVNTASEAVLASLVLPEANSGALNVLVSTRVREPFETLDAFAEVVRATFGEDDVEALGGLPLDVSSVWFEAQITAELDGRRALRRVILWRNALPAGTQVAYRADEW
ncbi:type II secretion system minor pseudopilin GspK [Roseovarius aestuariivivens]|uniref:type II secretion system minor pseudopilin GspK n=1 Tax=Roseovarius aestuariivivens TaxID=1888910 RepID=UPI0010801D14|nr:type II secretion system minor pseudopilin GspK [Roseovarius aestuariivivens]